jgi:tRNA dimethylallyltransferase
MSTKYNLIVILGPTASGKTAVAAKLASQVNGEIISADSRQVYQQLNLGTGKDYSDYLVGGKEIPFHLIDIAEPGSQYNVYEYQKDFIPVFEKLQSLHKLPILCGGSGLYIEAVIEGYKLIQVPVDQSLRDKLAEKSLEELVTILSQYTLIHNNSHTDSIKRAIRAIEIQEYYRVHPEINFNYPEIKPLLIGIKFDRATERQRITDRLRKRLDDGMIDEVKNLLKSGVTPEQLVYYGLEYKFLTNYVMNEISFEEMFSGLNTAIHQFAKRQMTWFRRMELKGMKIHWIDGYMPEEEKLERILALMKD